MVKLRCNQQWMEKTQEKVSFILNKAILNFGRLNLEHYRKQLFTEH